MKTQTGIIFRNPDTSITDGIEWFVDVDSVIYRVCFSSCVDYFKVLPGRDENRLIRFIPDNHIVPEHRVLFVDFV